MVNSADRDVLRSLAARVRKIADLPEMEIRKWRWLAHNGLHSERPMILCFPEGAWVELIGDEDLACQGDFARTVEWQLQSKLYWWDHIRDDHVLAPVYDLPWRVDEGNMGVQIAVTHGDDRGSYVWEPPIQDLDVDLEKLRFREPSVDREGSLLELETLEEAIGDLLPVRHSGSFWWTSGLTWRAIDLLGLEGLMMAMIDNPDGLHRLMKWLSDEHAHFMEFFESGGYLSPNNRHEYVGSGGVGYTDELDPTEPVLLKDSWGFAESQETVGCSPEMFAEFVLPYQLPLLERFGLNCYGCCEPINLRWKYVKSVPRLRRVSISPWCDQEAMAEMLGANYVFSRKPNPTLVCVGFDEKAIRADLRYTMDTAKGCNVEIILKDTHTVQNEPWRLTRWVEIALEEAQR